MTALHESLTLWYFAVLAWYRGPACQRLKCKRCGASVRCLEEAAWHMARAHARQYRGRESISVASDRSAP